MPRQLRIRDTVNGYTAIDHISTGMMAWAFKATDPPGRAVFLKQYKSPSRAVPWYEAYKAYQRELRQRLNDHSVGRFCVKLLDQFEADYGGAQFFQVYEFVHSGEDLGVILARLRKDPKALNWDQRLILAKVMMAGINQLHSAKIVHGDLKPPNLQLFRDRTIMAGWQLKLIDMDFSVLTDRRAPWHGESGYVGTPGYRSPEHLRGEVPLPASDVFTCGLILYELLAQGHPYLAEDEETYLRAIMAARVEPPRLLGRVIDDARTRTLADSLRRCLSADAANRPSARDVVYALNGRAEEAPRPATRWPDARARKGPGEPRPLLDECAPSAAPPAQSAAVRLIGPTGAMLELHVATPIGAALLKSTGFGAEAEYADTSLQFRLERRAGCWFVVPGSGTQNTTLLNGHLLETEAPLKDGDLIALGSRGQPGKSALPLKVRLVS